MTLGGYGRIAGALVIVLIFAEVLLTASAQQEVLRRLAGVESGLDYSSAYVIKLQVDQARKDARIAAANEQSANQDVSRASDAFDKAKEDFDQAWQSFAPQIRAVARTGKCDLPAPAAGATSSLEQGQMISALQDCVAGTELAPAQASRLKEALAASDGIVATWRVAASTQSRLQGAEQRVARARKQTTELAQLDAQTRKIADSFDATSKLRSSWYLGGGFLIDFPPALLQIILSFASGIFGALLITLVLVVYPNTALTITAQSGYGARILLGGLIALCVYVVINGGSAVLGTASAVATGNNNYMAFCAIGILAGMFSDRVAGWLSESANTFFKTSATGAKGKPAP
jgi:hypothetical protein